MLKMYLLCVYKVSISRFYPFCNSKSWFFYECLLLPLDYPVQFIHLASVNNLLWFKDGLFWFMITFINLAFGIFFFSLVVSFPCLKCCKFDIARLLKPPYSLWYKLKKANFFIQIIYIYILMKVTDIWKLLCDVPTWHFYLLSC